MASRELSIRLRARFSDSCNICSVRRIPLRFFKSETSRLIICSNRSGCLELTASRAPALSSSRQQLLSSFSHITTRGISRPFLLSTSRASLALNIGSFCLARMMSRGFSLMAFSMSSSSSTRISRTISPALRSTFISCSAGSDSSKIVSTLRRSLSLTQVPSTTNVLTEYNDFSGN